MIFESLMESARRDELILVDGGLCHWHLRRDGQLTIREIIVLPRKRGQGIGTVMLEQLKQVSGARSIFAKCPRDLEANMWYEAKGFTEEKAERTASGRVLRCWRLSL
jgi:GNAT superfamily N-acetyltransferase